MAFDWTGYLTLAKALKDETDGHAPGIDIEAKQRSAISRAYYAVYHMAEDYAKTHLGYVKGTTGQNQYHSDVRAEYKKQLANPDHQEVGKILFRLHKSRIDCDYKEDDLGNLEARLSSSILDAEQIESTLSSNP